MTTTYDQRKWAGRSLDENKNELFRILPQLEALDSSENKVNARFLKNEIVGLIQNIQNQVEAYHTQLLGELHNKNVLVSNLEHDNHTLRMHVHQNFNADELQKHFARLSNRFDMLNSTHAQTKDAFNAREVHIHNLEHENVNLKAQIENINHDLKKAQAIIRSFEQAFHRQH